MLENKPPTICTITLLLYLICYFAHTAPSNRIDNTLISYAYFEDFFGVRVLISMDNRLLPFVFWHHCPCAFD